MSWFDKPRAAFGALLLVVVFLSLAGCGFRPLYRQTPTAVVANQLAAIEVRIIADRSGQQLRTQLQTHFNPSDQSVSKQYALAVQLDESVAETVIRKDETATRANLILSARYRLTMLSSGQVLVNGRTRSTNSFNILRSEFATLASEQDARERALNNIGGEIQSHLAIFFQGPSQQRQSSRNQPYGGGYR